MVNVRWQYFKINGKIIDKSIQALELIDQLIDRSFV